jgi:hypothetical protein
MIALYDIKKVWWHRKGSQCHAWQLSATQIIAKQNTGDTSGELLLVRTGTLLLIVEHNLAQHLKLCQIIEHWVIPKHRIVVYFGDHTGNTRSMLCLPFEWAHWNFMVLSDNEDHMPQCHSIHV